MSAEAAASAEGGAGIEDSSITPATSDAPATGLAARPAAWWAAVALVISAAVLGAGALSGYDLREVLRCSAIGLAVVAALEDLRTRRIRNVLTAPAVVLALAGAPVLTSALLATLLAPLPFLLLAIVQPAAMGMGDVKLASVSGALVGLSGVLPWVLGTVLAGGALAVIAIIRGGRRGGTFAYGPALVISLLVATIPPLLGG